VPGSNTSAPARRYIGLEVLAKAPRLAATFGRYRRKVSRKPLAQHRLRRLSRRRPILRSQDGRRGHLRDARRPAVAHDECEPERRPNPGAESFAHSLIKSPLWSSLTSGHDPARAITRHDRSEAVPAVTSREVATGGRWITRLPASGLGVRFPRGAPKPQARVLSLWPASVSGDHCHRKPLRGCCRTRRVLGVARLIADRAR
jgi:hypothetical protein